MPWFNADSKMHSHPKIRAAGLEAMGLWPVSGTYAAEFLTDGFVPAWYVESWPKGRRLAQKTVAIKVCFAVAQVGECLARDHHQFTPSVTLHGRKRSQQSSSNDLIHQL